MKTEGKDIRLNYLVTMKCNMYKVNINEECMVQREEKHQEKT